MPFFICYLEAILESVIFLSKHSAESGVLALTCHCTGNFSEAKFGGKERQVAIPRDKSYKDTLLISSNESQTNPKEYG